LPGFEAVWAAAAAAVAAARHSEMPISQEALLRGCRRHIRVPALRMYRIIG